MDWAGWCPGQLPKLVTAEHRRVTTENSKDYYICNCDIGESASPLCTPFSEHRLHDNAWKAGLEIGPQGATTKNDSPLRHIIGAECASHTSL